MFVGTALWGAHRRRLSAVPNGRLDDTLPSDSLTRHVASRKPSLLKGTRARPSADSQDRVPSAVTQSSPPPYRAPSVGGGVQITNAWPGSKGPLFGEPLNVIISGLSSPVVLTPKGFLQYSHALGFSFECMGLHGGTPQQADLGDGKGWHDQVVEYREDYGCALLGTCIETFEGGNHFRAWQQDGPDSNTGALFLAVSKEEDLEKHHMIVPNGYNVGRDELVSFATAAPRKFSNVTYTTTAAQIIGLLPRGTQHINHGDTISQDGVVVLLTVTASAGTHK